MHYWHNDGILAMIECDVNVREVDAHYIILVQATAGYRRSQETTNDTDDRYALHAGQDG